jgi:type II secretory ATPase GspE/PulE/Tfp pilus assembly ATPase PilB-like protein
LNAPAPFRLGDRLLALGLLTQDQLQIALVEQKASGKMLGEVLATMGLVPDEVLREVVANALGQQAVSMANVVAEPAAMQKVPKALATRHSVFPLSFDAETRTLTLACARPNDIVAADQVRAQVGADTMIEWRLASGPEILTAIEQFYGRELQIDGILHELETGRFDTTPGQRMDDYKHPVVRLVDAFLRDAVARGASDVHFEPEDQFLRVRYRIDGMLRQIRVLHSKHWQPMLVRLKIVADMNIAETREAQDGRIVLGISGRTVDFRAASQPTVHGENFVLRVLDAKQSIVALDKLDMPEERLNQLKAMLARPEGIMLVTGPTGSGKTTTLYSVLGHLNQPDVNIMTLEDPVEYQLPMARQTALGATAKMTFMRQDPDIILVGEIRDGETAEMAFRAAMTGHQVFSTLHTNSAVRSIARLMDLGVTPEVMSGNIIGIIAQRLIRRLCPHCKEPHELSAQDRAKFGLGDTVVYKAKGCPKCDHQGYKGRVALMELLRFDPRLDELVGARASIREIVAYAKTQGFTTLAGDGLRRVAAGLTSIDEVGRVADLAADVID